MGVGSLHRLDGRYQLSFTTSPPATAVTLRLQLVFASLEHGAFSLTIPAVAINPPMKFHGNYPGSSFQVHFAGHSPSVARCFDKLDKMAPSRRGTARFGSWPEGINQYEVAPQYPVASASAGAQSNAPAAPE